MTSIDLRDAEVQQRFTSMKKVNKDTEKQLLAQQLAKMYQSNQQYSYGIFSRIIKFISESNDKQEKKIGLIVLGSLGPKMQGTSRSIFVNKFHSPVFKLLQTNTQQGLIQYIEKAYQVVLEMGGNRNDSAVQSNLSSCFSILQAASSKDVKKIGVYSLLRILVLTSPYITFKKLLQKQKNSNLDNLTLVISSAKIKNIKVRVAYLNFLVEYIKYIAEKKDQIFQKATFQRLFENYAQVTSRETSEEINHLYIETVNIFLTYLNNTIPNDRIKSILELCFEKIQNNKNPIIERSIITLLPKLALKKSSDEIISTFLKYLRSMVGEARLDAQQAINLILQNQEKRENFLTIYKDILSEILLKLKSIYKKEQSYELTMQLALLYIKTIDILLKKYRDDYQILITKQKLEQLVSQAMLVGLDEKIIRLVADIIKYNIHSLGRILEIKFIITLSKILTGSARKLLRDINVEFKVFIDSLQTKQSEQFLQTQLNKIKAIEALSSFRFRQEFRDVVGGFVRDCVLNNYLQWGNSNAKIAAVQAAFFLYPKKGKNIASNQMLQILDKLIRVGINDQNDAVRQKVFVSIVKNFKRHEQFIHFFNNPSLLNSLFKSLEDRNQNIKIQSLKIICILYKKNPSVYLTPYLNQYLYKCFYHLSSNFKYFPQKYFLIKSIVIIVEYAPSIIQNHIDNLLKLLLNYLSDQDNYQGLQELFFELIKTLALRIPNKIVPYAQQFCYHLVEAMKDKLNTRYRLTALKTFLSIIKQCGYVVIPYFQISSLKQTLAFLIRSEIEEQSRIDIMKIIGALGVFDNLRFSMINQSCSHSKTQCLSKSLQRLNVNSNFLQLRKKLIELNQKNPIEIQLKQYYDQLILLQSNKKLILFNTKQYNYDNAGDHKGSEQEKIQLQIDSTMNFHMFILRSLFQILGDKSLQEKHSLTLDVLAQLLQIMGGQIQKQVSKIMQLLLKLVKQNQQILNLIYIMGQKCDISAFVGQIIVFIFKECQNIQIIIKIVHLITAKYTQYLRHHIQLIIQKLHNIIENHFDKSKLIIDISFIYQNIQHYLEPYLNIIIPQIMTKFFKTNSQITNSFIDFIMNLAKSCPSILQYMPIITQHFSILLNLCKNKHSQCKPCLRNKICNCIVLFITLFKGQFVTYLPMLHRAILKIEQPHQLYFKAIRYLQICSFGNLNGVFSEQDLQKITPQYRSSFNQKLQIPKYFKRIQGIQQLIHEFDPIGKKIIDEDWVEWLRKNSILLLKKSPNTLLRTCSVLADEYNQLGLQLYNISFYHLWQVLVDDQKKILLDNIKRILTSNPKPFLLVRKTFLNLAQFMNRKKCAFELSSSLLADCAGESSSLAKQIYYKEQEFEANPQKTIQGMINTYMKLGQPQNAYGLFSIAAGLDIQCKIEWYEKIGKFQQAYKSYRELPEDRYSLQKMKCLSHISDQKFITQYQKTTRNKLNYIPKQVNYLAIEAYAHLGQWDKFQNEIVTLQQDKNPQQQFWKSILQIKKLNYDNALQTINKARIYLYEQIPDLMNFSSTSQAFDKLITLQQLFELEEIVQLKQKEQKFQNKMKNMDQVQRVNLKQRFQSHCSKLKDIWNDRLIGCYKSSSTYKKLSTVRSLLFSKSDYFEFYFQFCQLYIKEKKITKCEQLIGKLKSQLDSKNLQDKCKLVHLLEIKLDFSSNLIKQIDSIVKIEAFLEKNVNLNPLKIGQLYYLSAMTLYQNKSQNTQAQQKILSLLKKSAQLCNTYKEWYIFSTVNLQFAQTSQKTELIQKYISNALYSLINSLKITAHQNEFYLQGYLKLLSLLCKHSRLKVIYSIFEEEYTNIPVEGWINVVPQMIAQLYQVEETNFVKLLKILLKQLGQHHPESVLFSLNFALKSKIEERVKPSLQIIEHIRQKHEQLSLQIERISSQLCRAAIKLKEYWYDGIESAWSTYNQTKNTALVISTLKQLSETVMNRHQSNSELAFHQQFGQQLRDGYRWLTRYEKTLDPICLSQVFQTFYSIYKKVKDSFENVKKIYLKNVAPFLVTSKKYKSTIPGLYEPNKNCVKITGFCNELMVLQSKQRPRKLVIFGDDGKQYNFLLKGRQDLRLDQRVMQFFSLVNKLLATQRENLKRNLEITRYSIIPLTVNTGLIGWVQNCDTLNELIKEYRTMNKIRVYVQKQLYQKISPDYAYLPVINKLEIFKNGLESTQGKDLQKILWLKSPNSQVWVQKRNNYTCSLATMLMVGYILGLGDRHPSNIMLQRDSGKIVHIDFGDCFEVAVLRQKFPQRVPFRLTRMLQKAMGVPSIHGLFKFTCQMVMKILRQNKQSLFGVLQTFAQDPIISWRLTNQKKEEKEVNQIQINKNINDEIINSMMEQLQIEMTKNKEIKDIEDESPTQTVQNYENNQQINEKAVNALQRIKQKLKGTEFKQTQLTVEQQVAKLIQQATSAINICQSWPGWCPFW